MAHDGPSRPALADETIGVVTGASGFLGSAVLAALPVSATVYATYRNDEAFPERARAFRADVRPLRIDLESQRLTDVLPSEVDWALLLAARVQTVRSREDPVNELSTIGRVAFNSVAGLRARRVVYVSSGSVYETLAGSLGPGCVLAPRLPYSIAKLAAEHLVASACDVPLATIRFFGAYGPGEPAFKLVHRLVEAFAGGATSFSIRGDGTNRIDAMYTEDAARALLALATSAHEGILDLCQGESQSIQEFAEYVYATAAPDPLNPVALKFESSAHELMLGWADPAPADHLIGLQRRTLRQGLIDYVSWMRTR